MYPGSKNPGRIDVGLALERVPIGIAATGAGGKIEYANPYLCRLLGLTTEELDGLDIAQFRAAATARTRVEIRSTLLAGDTWQGEVALAARQG
jgi:PAS domain S-box-containing protein